MTIIEVMDIFVTIVAVMDFFITLKADVNKKGYTWC
jgi:hypothetical protein